MVKIRSSRKFTYNPRPRKVVALVNPNSGMGRGQKVIELLRGRRWNADVVTFETSPKGLDAHKEAIRTAESINADRLIISGGDGTVMETLTAQHELGITIPICIIPTGTGNIVANDLATPRRLWPAVREAFNAGILRWWDAGFLPDSNQVFALRASAGFEATVLTTMNEDAKQRWGIIAYAIPAVREFLRATPAMYTITIDAQQSFQLEGHVAFVAVTSRITSAFDFVISRDIHPDDGVLHVGVFHPRNLLQNLPAILNQGTLHARNMLSVFPVRERVTIYADPPQITQVDGEQLDVTPFTVETLPRSAAFITPMTPRGRRPLFSALRTSLPPQ